MDNHNLRPYLAIQLKEIVGHYHWIKESLQSDITVDGAIENWEESGQAKDFELRFNAHGDSLERVCRDTCCELSECKGLKYCHLDREYVHKVLYDRCGVNE